MDLNLGQHAIILVAGVLTGIINTLAGSGSLVTLPIFYLPLRPSGSRSQRHQPGWCDITKCHCGIQLSAYGNLPLEGAGWLLGPSIGGALYGAWLAVDMSNALMFRLIGGLMVFMLGAEPSRWLQAGHSRSRPGKSLLTFLIFMLIGLYGGIIQAGVGIFLLSALVLRGKYDLVKANALKSLAVLVFNIPALFVFIAHDQVHWGYGLLMASAQMARAVAQGQICQPFPMQRCIFATCLL
ncbi:MAG: sulfite exporter TauE/SafE family protein [Bacteroidia bacterium]